MFGSPLLYKILRLLMYEQLLREASIKIAMQHLVWS